MAEDTERTIYKLEIDGSAYTDGADKLANSTKKLSEAQEKANAKLLELQKTGNAYKKSLDEINAVLKANEKETLELTKQLNSLKDSEKATSAEANRLKQALRDTAVNTKELKAEAKELTTNLSTTTNQIKLQTKEIEAGAKASGGFTQGLSKVGGGLRLLANLIPGVGIGSLVALISGPLIEAFGDWFNAINQTSGALKLLKQNQENINEVMAAADKDAGKQIIDLKILYETATNVNVSMKDRLAAVKALQTEFPDYFANVKTETILNGEATTQYNLLAASILATAKATAAKAKLDILEAQKLDKDFEKQRIREEETAERAKIRKKDVSTVTATDEFGNAVGVITPAEQEKITQNREASRIAKVDQDIKDLQAQEDFIIAFAGLVNIAKTIKTKTKDLKGPAKDRTKEIENIYKAELDKLKADIAKLDEKGFTTEESITAAVAADFQKRTNAFDKAFKNKQLTAGQLTSLKEYLANLQALTLEQNLKSFREQKAAYLKQIQSELDSLEIQENTKRISAIQDRFERERQTIIAESDKTANDLGQRRDKQIADISKNAAKNGLTAADVAPQIEAIKGIYRKLLDDIEIIKQQKLQQLSFDTFEKLSEDAKRLLDSGNLGVSQGSLINIKEQTALFLAGKISYKQYQKELTEIAKFEAQERFRLDKLFLEAEIKIRQEKLASDKSLTTEQTKRLEDEIRRLQQQLADASKANEITTAGNTNKDVQEKIDTVVKYAQAIGGLVTQVIGFWQAANAAEAAALDESIALQEKRVDAAQKIADRGNAQYLKQEQDRLTQLNVQKENAARKQLGINAALQASEILVALISGLAQGAKIGGGLGAIASVAAIVAAIAGAFAIAASLKPPTPTFFRGTKDTGKGGREDSKGGFTATLHPHEAVTPADKNKAYHPVISAIHDGTIPAETLNSFVNTYHKIKTVPQVDYSRIKGAAELHIGANGRMAVLLQENNELQRQTLRAMKSMSVSANIDRDGVAIVVNEYISKMEIDKRI